MSARRRRKLWGWGYEGEQPELGELESVARAARAHLGLGPATLERPLGSEGILGVITEAHHHAVGRDHRESYDRQRPAPFAAALRAAKATVDPQGILNPGVLVDP